MCHQFYQRTGTQCTSSWSLRLAMALHPPPALATSSLPLSARHTPHATRTAEKLCLESTVSHHQVTCHMSPVTFAHMSFRFPRLSFFHGTAPHPPPLDEGLFCRSSTLAQTARAPAAPSGRPPACDELDGIRWRGCNQCVCKVQQPKGVRRVAGMEPCWFPC